MTAADKKRKRKRVLEVPKVIEWEGEAGAGQRSIREVKAHVVPEDLFSEYRFMGCSQKRGREDGAMEECQRQSRVCASTSVEPLKRCCPRKVENMEKEETKSEERKKRQISPQFTAAQKCDVAYLRITRNDTWKPPRSPYTLLQENHVYDPWRVLTICILLNRTSGRQVRPILNNFFTLCPNAEAVAKVPLAEIRKSITNLGLQNKRAATIKRFSEEYLRDDWTHVPFLYGIGRYAADAYAIFCTGKWDQVAPMDKELKVYCKYLKGNPQALL